MTRNLSAFAFFVSGAFAQPPAAPVFEVASIKLVAEPKIPAFVPDNGRCSGGPNTNIAGKFECKEISLRSLLARAYNLPRARISGPDWMDTARYDLDARLELETTPENFRLMLQGLLVERFSVRLHRETRSSPVYLLSVAANGPRLTPARKAPEYADASERKSAVQASLQKNLQALAARREAGGARSFRNFGLNGTVAKFAETLSSSTDREVIDLTQLEGQYQFELSWTPDPDGGDEPSLFAAIQEQLGLKLQIAKKDLEFLIIEHAERMPAGN